MTRKSKEENKVRGSTKLGGRVKKSTGTKKQKKKKKKLFAKTDGAREMTT